MGKKLLAGLITALAACNANALTAGDLAFTSFNADEDGWSMVALTNISANTTVFFSDNEYIAGAFNTGESFHKWVSGGSVISAGTVIRFTSVDSATLLGASAGTLTREAVALSTNYGISATADTIYAYQGASASAPATFLAAISSGGFSATDGPLAGTGLSVGVNAVQLTNSSDFAEYNGARSGQSNFAAYLPLVANVANWNVQGDGTFTSTVPNTTNFTITPVPEPETWAMLLAGLGLLGLAGRRRA